MSKLPVFAAAGIAFGVAACASPLAARAARRLGVMDRPGPMKPQPEAVPYLGGTAVFLGLVAGLGWFELSPIVILAGALALGLSDDVRPLSPVLRLVVEALLGVGVVALVPVRGPVAALAVIALTVTLINAVNFLDGLDGLAGGVTLAAALGFAAVQGSPALALSLAGAVAGFLLYNRPPARIYLGDAGSYLIGSALAVLLARAWSPGTPDGFLVAGVLLVGVPLAEIGTDVLRRIRAGLPLFGEERGHVYDQLVTRGWRPATVAVAFFAAQAVLAVAAVWTSRLGPAAFAAGAVVVLGLAGAVAAGRFTSGVGPWTHR